jgi:hypothetical protein
MKKHLSKLLFLVIGLSLAATASYLNAWSGPTQTAPDGNVDAPINVGGDPQGDPQIKTGNLEAYGLSAVGVVANQFCLGSDCITAWPSGGASVPAGTVAAFNLTTCPAGWIPSDGNNGTPDLRGYFIRGYGTNSDGTSSGAFGVKQADEFKSHDHKDVYGRSTNTEWDWVGTNGGSYNFLAPNNADGTWVVGDSQGPWTQVNAQGGSETRPKNVALLFCQKDGTSSGGGSNGSWTAVSLDDSAPFDLNCEYKATLATSDNPYLVAGSIVYFSGVNNTRLIFNAHNSVVSYITSANKRAWNVNETLFPAITTSSLQKRCG